MSRLLDRLEDEAWARDPSAFWLDPDRWHGVEDTHRDMFWMKLDERPPPAVFYRPHAHVLIEGPRQPGTYHVVERELGLAILARANELEDDGAEPMFVNLLRAKAIERFRNR